MSQVINSRPLEKYAEKYASSGTLADLVYIHYAFLIPPIQNWAREKRLNLYITGRWKRSLSCVHFVATKIINLFLILNQSNAGFHRRTLEGCVQISNNGFKCKRRLRFFDRKPLPFFTGLNKQSPPNRGSRKKDLWSLYTALWNSVFVFELLSSHGSVRKDCPELRKATSHKELIC